MKIRHAEMLFKRMRRNKTLTKPLTVITEEGVTFTGLPPGWAAYQDYGDWNYEPPSQVISRGHSALFQGGGIPHHVVMPKMWPLEWMVYEREKREAVDKALKSLRKTAVLAHKGDYVFVDDVRQPDESREIEPIQMSTRLVKSRRSLNRRKKRRRK